MKAKLLAAAVLLMIASPAFAQAIDPLHGYAMIGGVPTNTDTGAISPINLGGTASGFGFFASPAPQTGQLDIVELVPNGVAGAPTSLLGNVGSGTTFINDGVWSSGDLATFLSLPNSSPANPFAAFASGDTSAPVPITSFTVYEAAISGNDTLQNITNSIMSDTIAGAFVTGDLLTAFMVETSACGCQNTVSTAPSGVLMQTATINPVPGPVAGAGLPGLFAGIGGLWMLAKRRRQRRA